MSGKSLLPLLSISAALVLHGVQIPVPNHSFEQPAVWDAQADGWTANATGISGGLNRFSVAGGFSAADDGNWFHYLNLPGFGGVNPSVTESHSGLIGTAATGTYTLTVAGGHRINGATTNGSYVIELLAGGNVIASQTLNDPKGSIPVDSWQDITAVGTVEQGDPTDGQDLTIRLSATSGTSGQQGQFDNVRLDYEPGNVFTVSGRQIYLDGAEFEVNGVCYQPAAIGENPSTMNPDYGDYYYTPSSYPDRWTRDFENFRKMGINVIRLYGWNPARDHTAFLDLAASNGIHVLVNRYVNPFSNFDSPAVVNDLVTEWQSIVTPIADHPAVMGFLIGNEANNGPYASFWSAMNTVAGAVKVIAPNKLVSIAITNNVFQVSLYNSAMTNLDFWAIQVYNGSSFHPFLFDYVAVTPPPDDKPLIITEFGYDALNGPADAEWPNNAELSANAMENLINELRADELGADIASGGCVFEYADEWWKSDANGGTNASTQDTNEGWLSGAFADGEGNEEWWGIFRLVDNGSDIDILQPRAMFYRIAAMWNEPYDLFLQASAVGQNLQFDFFYPEHLKEQALTVESSYDLANWSTVAENGGGSVPLLPLVDSLDVSLTEVGDDVWVSLLHAADAPPGEIPNLLVNGGFETGTAAGWITDRGASDAESQAGTYSLELTTVGGFTVPTAFQSLPASPADEFNLSGYMLTPSALPADTTYGLLKIVFMDLNGTPLAPASVSPGMGTLITGEFAGAESQPLLNSSSSVGSWVFSQVQAVAPAGTVGVQFFAINVDESPNTMYFDSIDAIDVNANPAPSGPNIFFRVTNNGR